MEQFRLTARDITQAAIQFLLNRSVCVSAPILHHCKNSTQTLEKTKDINLWIGRFSTSVDNINLILAKTNSLSYFCFVFWTIRGPNTLYRCLSAYWLGFRLVKSCRLIRTWRYTHPRWPLTRRQLGMWVSSGCLSTRAGGCCSRGGGQGGQLPRTRAHEPLPEPLLHGLQEVSSRQTS